MPNSFYRFCRGLWLLMLPLGLLLSSCASNRYFNQRTLFRLTDRQGRQLDSTKLRVAVNRTERNYLIQANDYLEVRVNTNKGERILDPNGELQFGQPSGALPSRSALPSTSGSQGGARSMPTTRPVGQNAGSATAGSEFLVQADGTVVLPLINRIKLSGYSLLQADSVLQVRYSEYYKDAFVTTRVTNNRVFVLGASGGQVIPLANDNMNLIEVLALAGGIDGGIQGGGGGNSSGFYRYGGKANNIRIIRGDLKNPRVQQVDLTTLDGMRRANLQMEPNDIVYVEPVHRPVLETLTDAAPLISFASLTLTTTLFLINLFK